MAFPQATIVLNITLETRSQPETLGCSNMTIEILYMGKWLGVEFHPELFSRTIDTKSLPLRLAALQRVCCPIPHLCCLPSSPFALSASISFRILKGYPVLSFFSRRVI